MYTRSDIDVLVMEAERLLYNPPEGPLGDALYHTIVAQATKAHALLMGCKESVMEGRISQDDKDVQINITRAILSLNVGRLLVATNLPEGSDA